MRMLHHVVLNAWFGEVLRQRNCDAHDPSPAPRKKLENLNLSTGLNLRKMCQAAVEELILLKTLKEGLRRCVM